MGGERASSLGIERTFEDMDFIQVFQAYFYIFVRWGGGQRHPRVF
jgi:hypothetical protein